MLKRFRQSRWPFALLTGLATACVLSIYFKPRPEHIISLPPVLEGTDETYDLSLFKNQSRAEPRVCEPNLDWVAVLPNDGWHRQSPHLFVQPTTGKLVSWTMPFPDDPSSSFGFDANGRFLEIRYRPLIDDNESSSPAEILWFRPDTEESGRIIIPELEYARYGSQVVSDDGSAWVSFRHADERYIDVRVFDLQTESVRSTCRIDMAAFPEGYGQRMVPDGVMPLHCVLSPDGNQVGILPPLPEGYWRSYHDAAVMDERVATTVDIHDCTTGNRIEKRWGSYAAFVISSETKISNAGPFEPPQFRGKWLLSTGLSSDASLWIEPAKRQLQIVATDGKVLGICPVDFAAEAVDRLVIDYGFRNPPLIVPGTTGVISNEKVEKKPGVVHKLLAKAAAFFNVPTKSEPASKWVLKWYDWQNDQSFTFETDDANGWDVAVVQERICLLVNANGPNSYLEIWRTPPTQRPKLVIATVSLLMCVASMLLRGKAGGFNPQKQSKVASRA